MKVIVSVDLNWGIGCGGRLLQRIPEDMKFFKQTTLGKVVIMGRETFESLPGKSPLIDRINIVLSRDKLFIDDRIVICRSLDEVFDIIEKYNTDDIYVIGGESIYIQFLPYCTEAYVTKIRNRYSADKHFPNLDEKKIWDLVSISNTKVYNNIEYNFLKYENSQLMHKV
jgi:dihydrofolate reductase